MLRKTLLLLLTLLLALPAMAEENTTLVLTSSMAFFSGPGPQYTQGAYHNTPPQPGETATVLGRVPGANGQDWLLVRFTGHWFSQALPVQYYLPVSDAPAFSDAPLLTFTREPNALAAEYVNVYADPEGENYDGWLTPDEAGVTVLEIVGSMAYIEAVNPYGYPMRGYISVRDLTVSPGAAALPAAQPGTAVRTLAAAIPLTCAPQNSSIEALSLSDGTTVLRYDTLRDDGTWCVALAVIGPDGQLRANFLHRTHAGAEESTVEFLLAAPEGFRICRCEGDEMTPIRQTIYTSGGELLRTEVRRFADDEPRPGMGTAGFTLAQDVHAGEGPLAVCITTATGATARFSLEAAAGVLPPVEAGGLLLLPVTIGAQTELLIFNADAALVSRTVLPQIPTLWAMSAAPIADGQIALLLSVGSEEWQSGSLSPVSGTFTPGPTFTAPSNRSVNLLAAQEGQLLVAVSGVDTQLLLIGGVLPQLAAQIPGTIVHARTDGSAATLLLLQDGQLRLERWELTLP